MAVVVRNKRGKDVILLNPFEKGTKMFKELRNNVHITNDNMVKTDNLGNPQYLSDTQKAYRSGYLAAQKDSNKAFKAKHPRYKRKTTNR